MLSRSLLFALWILPAALVADDAFYCCGGEEVIKYSRGGSDEKFAKVLTWTAAKSPEIPEELHAAFKTTADCKPAGDKLLIVSSGGGVALVDPDGWKCHFYTRVPNAHRACLLPNDHIAIASSIGGNHVEFFKIQDFQAEGKKITKLPLDSAHGVVWDKKRQRLWALGYSKLLLINIDKLTDGGTPIVEKRIALPNDDGHDLTEGEDCNAHGQEHKTVRAAQKTKSNTITNRGNCDVEIC